MTIPFNPLIPGASHKPSLGQRLVTVLVVGSLFIILIGSIIWGVRLNPPSSSARAPVLAVSKGDVAELQALVDDAAAPAVRSSSPAADAPTIVAENDTKSVATSDKDRSFTFNRGDTAGERFGKDAKKFCEYNQIADCNRVKADVEYKLPEGVTPRASKLTKHEPQKATARHATGPTKSVAKPATSKTNDAGEILYRRVGVAPLRNCGKRVILSVAEEAWEVLGLSQEDRAYLRQQIDTKNGPRLNLTEAEGRFDIPTGMRLEQVTFCRQGKVVKLGPMRTDWDEKQQAEGPVKGERFQLPSGQTVVWMRNCFNWVLVDIPPPQKKEPPPVEPPVVQEPPVVIPPEKVEPPVVQEPPASAPTPTEALPRKSSCIRPEGVGGQEFEPPQDGVQTRATYVAADIRCIIYDGEDYQVSVGIGGTYVEWDGKDGQGGNYGGDLFLAGLSTKVVSHNDGWDAALRFPAFGKFESSYRNAAYGNDRGFKLGGLTLSVNDFRRKLEGHEWWYETQYNFSWAKALGGSKVGQTIFGRPYGDTSGLGLDYYANATIRQYITRLSENSELYAQLGYNIEEPVASSMSARVGAAFYERCVGAGFGLDQKIKPKPRGKPLKAFGYWVDPFQCGEAYRIHVRGKQIVREAKSQGINFAPDSIGPAPSDD